MEILSAAGTLIAKVKGKELSHSPPSTLILHIVEKWGRNTHSLDILFLKLSHRPPTLDHSKLSHVTSNDKPKIARDDFPAGLPVYSKLCEMHAEIKSLKKRHLCSSSFSQGWHWKSRTMHVYKCVCVSARMCGGKRLLAVQCPCQSREILFHSVPWWEISISMHGDASLGLWTRISVSA